MENNKEEKSFKKSLGVYISKLAHKSVMGKTQLLLIFQGIWHLSALIGQCTICELIVYQVLIELMDYKYDL